MRQKNNKKRFFYSTYLYYICLTLKIRIMKKVHFITETELLYGANNYLKGIFQVDKKDRENGYIDMWHDCDHVKVEGESGRGDVYKA